MEVQIREKTKVLTSKTMIAVYSVVGLGFLAAGFVFIDKNIPQSQVVCEDQTEEVCQQHTTCQSIYDASIKFTKCITLSQEYLQTLSQSKVLCVETSGIWQKTKYVEYCDCSNSGQVFKKGEGCK